MTTSWYAAGGSACSPPIPNRGWSGEARTVSHELARIPVLRPDVAVVDVILPDGNGIELCRDLLSRSDEPRCPILTARTAELHRRWRPPRRSRQRPECRRARSASAVRRP